MNRRSMKHLLVVLGVLVGAVASYATGFGLGIGSLLVAGAVLEIAFWILALTGSDGSRIAPPSQPSQGRTNPSVDIK